MEKGFGEMRLAVLGFSTTCRAWSVIDDGHTVIAGFPDAIVSVDDAFII